MALSALELNIGFFSFQKINFQANLWSFHKVTEYNNSDLSGTNALTYDSFARNLPVPYSACASTSSWEISTLVGHTITRSIVGYFGLKFGVCYFGKSELYLRHKLRKGLIQIA